MAKKNQEVVNLEVVKTSEETSAALANISSKTLAERLEILKKELEGLQVISDSPFSTGDYKVLHYGSVKEVNDLDTLIMMAGSVTKLKETYQLGLDAVTDKEEFKKTRNASKVFGGHSPESIIRDIRLKIAKVTTDERRTKLQDYVKKYSDLMSNQDRLQLLDMELTSFLG